MTRTAALMSVLVLIAGLPAGCAHRHVRDVPPPRWTAPATPFTAAPQVEAPAEAPVVAAVEPTPAMVPVWTGQRTFTAGCSGHFIISDAGGRAVQTGRAFNTGDGLVTIDARGQRGGPVPAAAAGQSVGFLPDCACRQRAEAALATPATAACR